MGNRVLWAICFSSVVAGLSLPLFSRTLQAVDKPSSESAVPDDLNDLKLEVTALKMLHDLKITTQQLQILDKIAKETAAGPGKKGPAKASPAYAKLLANFHTALIKGDSDLVANLEEELDKLQDKEQPAFEDEFDITAKARQHAPAMFRGFGVHQLASYISAHEEEFVDPYGRLLEGLKASQDLKGAPWETTRDLIAEEIGDLLDGLDQDLAAKTSAQVKTLLDKAHKMKKDDYKKRSEALNEEARVLTGKVAPTEVVRHILEQVLAELLSNPRLSAAVQARLKNGKP